MAQGTASGRSNVAADASSGTGLLLSPMPSCPMLGAESEVLTAVMRLGMRD